MPKTFHLYDRKYAAPSFDELYKPTEITLATANPLVARGNRPLQMNFEQQLRALVYFHLEEHTSGRHLIQALEEDDFARNHIAPPDGIHLKVYHLIARPEYGLMVQILSGLITYLLLAIYCHNHYKEKVSIKRVRELRIKIQNELRDSVQKAPVASEFSDQGPDLLYAQT
jgi:hypothetical protein